MPTLGCVVVLADDFMFLREAGQKVVSGNNHQGRNYGGLREKRDVNFMSG
jgi:hypothetical protein